MTRIAGRDLAFPLAFNDEEGAVTECTDCTNCTNKSNSKSAMLAGDGDLAELHRQLAGSR